MRNRHGFEGYHTAVPSLASKLAHKLPDVGTDVQDRFDTQFVHFQAQQANRVANRPPGLKSNPKRLKDSINS